MATYTVSNIIKDVRVILDENEDPDATYASTGVLDLDAIIKSKIRDSVEYCMLAAPRELLGGSEAFYNPAVGESTKRRIVVQMPTDYLRFCMAQVEGWDIPVYGYMSPEDPRYRLLNTPYGGVGATKDNPVCVIRERAGERTAELYPGGNTVNIYYYPRPQIISDQVNIEDRLYPAVKYHIAAMTALTLRDEYASTLFAQVNELLK